MAKLPKSLFFLVLWLSLLPYSAFSAQSTPALLKAKSAAETKGYVFDASRDEIVAKAKQEGRLRIASTLDEAVLKAMREAFVKKYPFLDVRGQEFVSVEDNQRLLLEIKAGAAKTWDVNRVYADFYEEFLPYQKKFDILGMAEHKVLQIPPVLVDPRTRNIVTTSSNINTIGYNKKLLPQDKVPQNWEDLLSPEFKGRKLSVDIRPLPFAMLVPGWGLERTVDFARRIAAQNPIWGRGQTRMISSVANGDATAVVGSNLGAVKRAQEKDPAGVLGMKIVEPVPIRFHETYSVLNSAEHPYAGLLWIEFMVSPEGQKIFDDYWPLGASVLSSGSAQQELTRGKKLSLVDWNQLNKVDGYLKKIVEAMGFPKAQ